MLTIIIALGLFLLTTGLILAFSLPQLNRGWSFRSIKGFDQLKLAISKAVENGTRIHLALGNGSIIQSNFASGLTGLATLDRIAQITTSTDRPPLATSGSGPMAILSQSTLRSAYRDAYLLEVYDPDRGLLAGVTPFSYVAGILPTSHSKQVSTHIFSGSFGPEIALAVEAAEKESAFTIASSDSMTAQAVLFATANEPLIGEELFAMPAYLKPNPFHSASLAAQDVLRWGIIAFLMIGALLRVLGIL